MKGKTLANKPLANKLALLLLMAYALTGCSTFTQTTPAALPTIVLDNNSATSNGAGTTAPLANSAGVTASGIVVPAQEVHMAFTLQEKVVAVNAAVGDRVKAGQVLVELDDSMLRAQIQQAEAAVATAQANYDLLAAGPTNEQIRQAEAALVIATANYSRTVAGTRPSDIAAAQSALTAATDAYDKVKAGPQPEDYAAVEAAYRNAEAALQQAQFAYDAANQRDPAGIGASPAALALQQATNNYNAAKAAYDKVARQPDAAQISAAYQHVVSARATLDGAMHPARDFDIAQARAQIDQAQAQLDALKAGARAQQLGAAKAQVDAAEAALGVLETQLQKYTLVAPMDAVLLSQAIQPGETVLPGTVILVLADLDHLRVETTDLSERDVSRVEKGQPVTVIIQALNQNVTGHVSDISPLANTLGGDVVYKSTIDLDTFPSGLRAGMSVDVQFGTNR
ncbi:MAG: HlyD family efflux transporter periplasmic adaptor subunit [Chloroflexi bacterium]|nr:HlyD family efflux transporter periplasmic adaptor subunit [Chloroflexota bacterium]